MTIQAKTGEDYIDHADARWVHTACILHRADGGDGSGHNPKCPACVETARETVAHIKAVETNA